MDNPKPSGSPPYGKVLILGAIAAASAFVVTILIVLVCVGCQRKNKPKHAHAGGENHKSVDTNLLRQSKLNPMSKSDTRLHEMHRVPCSVNGGPKSRPASMDLLLLHSRRSNSDLRVSNARLLPQVPNSPGGEEREHTYSEVGYRASPSRCLDDGLYESVGVKGTERDPEAPPPAPPPTSANTPAQRRAQSPVSSNGNGTGRGRGVNGISLEPVTAEYASIRKVRKVERGQRRENNGMEQTDVELQRLSSAEPTTSTLQRKAIEPFHLPNFPKEAVFIGNGEQYIWKPPEEDDIIIPSGPPLENGQGHSTAAEMTIVVPESYQLKHGV
ncbi:uncharacterized protein LOC115806852 [Chanos chanos]|uniref:Uncharacterized protein LOC115806852 n=1 Tax=Chanos chanos TaxID=29144 RepID=A0A6J2UV23_CHACN|nr:lck-interacting transmembrane adapter 1 [Chanos chanos]